jgi:hypothetical protein
MTIVVIAPTAAAAENSFTNEPQILVEPIENPIFLLHAMTSC